MQKNMPKCVTRIVFDDVSNFSARVDTVLQNPPFGVKKLHADGIFLERAFESAGVAYSFHKSESTDFRKNSQASMAFPLWRSRNFPFPSRIQ